MKPVALTGDRPTGPLHLGHYVGSLQSRLQVQHTHNQYIMIADLQALTDNMSCSRKIGSHVWQVIEDYIAIGLEPSHNTFFLQSAIPALSELFLLFLNLVTQSRVERNPTVKSEMLQKHRQNISLPMGFVCYPISQAADILAFRADIVPVGDDQIPMIEQTNEIVRSFYHLYEPVELIEGTNPTLRGHPHALKECQYLVGRTPRLPGIWGEAKASKSLGNAIFLSDDAETVKNKVFSMYTDPEHIRVSDPGRVEGNVVFDYLSAFADDVTNYTQENVDDLKAHYRRGGLGDISIKNILTRTLEGLLASIRERRSRCTQQELWAHLHDGTKKARNVAHQTLEFVRDTMGILSI